MVSNKNHDRSLISRSMLRALGLAALVTIGVVTPSVDVNVATVAFDAVPRDALRLALIEPFSLT